jgi:hypothetical protein
MNTKATANLTLPARPALPGLAWCPLLLPLATAFALRQFLPAWGFMWLLAFAVFLGCKWFTWGNCPVNASTPWKVWAYFLAWPGLDARSFLSNEPPAEKPALGAWLAAAVKTSLGAMLLWGVARWLPASSTLAIGWCGLFGLIFLLHFGTFDLVSLAWRQAGVNAVPLMNAPTRATSLGEFWGRRWNSAFNRVAHDAVFRPVHRRFGTATATMAVFLASGLVHDLVISVPARGGYGLPTLYFILQGAGVLAERSPMPRRRGLRHGYAGWCFTLTVTAAPAFWLFHPPFVRNVVVPMLHAIGALPKP